MEWKKMRILSVLLAFVLAVSSWNFNVQAAPGLEEGRAAVQNGGRASLAGQDLEMEGTDSFGDMLAAALSEEAERDSGESYISGLEIKGNSAMITYASSGACEAVAAIYDEKTGQMLASGTEALDGGGEGTAAIALKGDVPKHFRAAAYLLDPVSHAPLCGSYATAEYTEEMQKLADMGAGDFAEDRVLNIDGDMQNNFAVYKEGTKVIGYQEGKDQVSEKGDGAYTVRNASEGFKSLKAGDTFSYVGKDGEALIAKAKDVKVEGDTVMVTEDPSLRLEDAFDYVKIEGGFKPELQARGIFPVDIDKELTALQKGFDWAKTIGSGSLTAVLKASGSLTAAPYIKVYLAPSSQHVECTVTFSASFECSVNGKASRRAVDLLDSKIELSPVKGVTFTLMPQIEFEASGEASFTAKMAAAAGFSWDGGKNFVNKCISPRLTECNFHVEAQIYLGLRLAPEIAVGFMGIDVGNVSMDARAGVLLVGKLEAVGVQGNASHLCKACIGGDISAKIQVNVSAALLSLDPVSKEVINASAKVSDFYYSFDFDDFGWRTCPHYAYKVTLSTVDANGNPVPNIEVIGTGLEENPVTDARGKAEIFLESGSYTLNVRTAEYKGTADIVVENTAQNVELKLEGRSVVASGECGTDLEWRLDDGGVLAITGTGDMNNWNRANDVPWYNSHRNKITAVEMDEGVTGIGDHAFEGCVNLANAPIPGTVTDIGKSAFAGCSKLAEAVLPGSVTYLGANAFYNCDGLTEMKIPSSVTFIEKSTFQDCDELKHVTVPSSVTVIEQSAFESCDKLLTAEIGGGKINASAFKDCAKMTTATLGSNVRSNIEASAFQGCSSLRSIAIPDGVTKIAEYAFQGCSSLSSATLGNGITDIAHYAFADCTRLARIAIPDKVTHIGGFAFSYCSSLSALTFGSSLSTIDNYAFQYCSRLGSVTFPASVKQIGAYDFYCCSSLSTIYFEGAMPYCTYIDGHGYNGWACCFGGVVATAYYPSSWEKTPDPGANITWVPYGAASSNSNQVAPSSPEEEAVEEAVPDAIESLGSPEGEAVSNTVIPKEKLAAGKPSYQSVSVTLKALASSESSAQKAGQQAAYFSGLTAGSPYVMLVVKNANAEKLLSADNLLYIAQGDADAKGRLIFQYISRTNETAHVKLYGLNGTADPADPDDPIFKDDPDNPDNPDNPDKPDDPDNPDKPVDPDNPDKPVDPDDPDNPDKPVDPDNPADTKTDIGNCTVSLSSYRYVYSGSEKRPAVTVNSHTAILIQGQDYKAFYENNINAGTATVTVIGIGKYTGVKTAEFIIQKGSNTVKASNLTKTASAKAQNISLKATAKGKASLSYKSNTKAVKVSSKGKVSIAKNYVGGAVITITAAATPNYKQATAKIKITVNPSKVRLAKAQNRKGRKLDIRWTKNSLSDGYQIQYSTDSKFKKGTGMLKISGAKKTSKVLTKLKKGKTFHIRVRAYKKSAGSFYYSSWSNVKKAKVKK